MFRATTPTHKFIFDVDPEETFQKILVTYAQNGKIVLEKTKSDLTFDRTIYPDETVEYYALVKLTEQETKRFLLCAGQKVAVQVRVLTTDGDVVAFDKMTLTLEDVLNDEVLS